MRIFFPQWEFKALLYQLFIFSPSRPPTPSGSVHCSFQFSPGSFFCVRGETPPPQSEPKNINKNHSKKKR